MPRTNILNRSHVQSGTDLSSENAPNLRKRTRAPASVRMREQRQRTEAALAASSVNDARDKPLRRTGELAESSGRDEPQELSILDSDSFESDQSPPSFTQPRLSARGRLSAELEKSSFGVSTQAVPSAVTMLAETIWDAIDKEHWDLLGRLVDRMHDIQFRFDAPELKQSGAAQKIIQSAPLALLEEIEGPNDPDGDNKWLLALDLVDLGCNPTAKDFQGNSVVDLLRQKADKALVSEVLSDRPDLKHLLVSDTALRSRPSSDQH